MKVQTNEAQHIFEVRVYLNSLDSNVVRVKLFAHGINGSDPIRQEMTRIHHPAGAAGGYMYRTMVSVSRPATDYTARITSRTVPAWRYLWKTLTSYGSGV
jgi:starch phosphorylase